jgi:hypothetical protein
MTVRSLHRLVGLVMVLPFIGWAVTGAIFFLKPGYTAAYDQLHVRTYPLISPISVTPQPDWLSFRVIRTVLGDHLLVETTDGLRHLDPATLQPRPGPSESELRALLNDAIAVDPQRYGRLANVYATTATTDTGVRISLSWMRMTLAQRGRDTDRIDTFYKVHYLQWTGVPAIDHVLGAAGLLLLTVLTVLGVKLAFRK